MDKCYIQKIRVCDALHAEMWGHVSWFGDDLTNGLARAHSTTHC